MEYLTSCIEIVTIFMALSIAHTETIKIVTDERLPFIADFPNTIK